MSEEWASSEFWDWSTELYARPGVAALCLSLQERAGADVNLLLLACWLAGRGLRMEPAMVAAGQRWQAEVVVPLRSARRALKARLAGAGELAPPALVRLRRAVAAAELDAERLEQIELDRLAQQAKPSEARGRALALTNLDTLGDWAAAERDALLDLVAATIGSEK